MATTKNLATVPSIDLSNAVNLLAEVNGEIVRLPYSLIDEKLVPLEEHMDNENNPHKLDADDISAATAQEVQDLKTEFSEYKISNDAELAQQKSDLDELEDGLVFVVTVTAGATSNDLTADKTHDAISGAFESNKICTLLYKSNTLKDTLTYTYSHSTGVAYYFANIQVTEFGVVKNYLVVNDDNSITTESELFEGGTDIEIVQSAGDSETSVMSQKAVTDLVNSAIGGAVEYETVDSIEEMTDTNKSYILSTTGTLWSHLPTETTREVDVTEQIVATDDNPAKDGYTMGTNGESANAAYTISPYIDLHKYGFPCTLNLNGLKWVTATPTGKIRVQTYDETKTLILQYSTALSGSGYWPYAATGNVKIIDETHATVDFPEAYIINSSKTVRYLRFGAEGKWANADVSVTYKGTEKVIGDPEWQDTGIVLEDIKTFCLVNPSVKSFDSVTYPNGNYTESNVGTYAVYDYYRKDFPLPIFLTWDSDVMAVEYTVALGTESSIPTSKAKIYYTNTNRIEIYNLIPNTKYYYTVTALCVNGTKKTVKTGDFTTTKDKTRMLKVDGIQNVRDIGGYIGNDGKTVKYGLIYRGSAMDEDASRHLYLTDEGRKEMTERLGIKTDIDLRYGYSKSPLNANAETSGTVTPDVAFVKTSSGYENYASAFTVKSQRTNFATLLSSIVTALSNGAVYFHCQGGCDRTGTLAFLLLGLLGVSESDLAKEYELSSFAPIGYTRNRNSTKYTGMIEKVNAYSGGTIAEKIYTFATKANDDTETGGCGITAETIESFRNLMLN